MLTAQAIARLAGPVLSAIGVGMLTNQDTYRQMGAQFLAGYPFIYFSGILGLIAGLSILNSHSGWTRDWRSIVTAIGWVLMCVGAFRIVAPQFVAFIGSAVLANAGFFTGTGIVLLAIGGVLTFKGYAV